MGYMIKICPGLAYDLTILGNVVIGYAVDRGDGKLPLGAAGGLGLRHPYARTAFNRLIPLGYFPQMLWISCFINDGVYFPLAIDITI